MSYKRTYLNRLNLLVVVLSAVLCLVALGAAGYMVSANSQSVQAAAGFFSLVAEGNTKTGTLSQGPEVWQRELNNAVEEGVLVLSTNITPFMKNGRATANLLIENSSENIMWFTITIRRNDSGEMIYQSGHPDPEQYIDDVSLDVEMLKREYPCTTYLDAYRISDNAYVGRARVQITSYVPEQSGASYIEHGTGNKENMTNGKTREEGERPGSRGTGVSVRRGGSRRIGGFLFLPSVVCCVVGAAGGVYLSRRNAQEGPLQGLMYEASVAFDDISGKSREERQKEMDSLVEEGMSTMSMNITPSGEVSGGDRGINWFIENPSDQGELIRVEITQDGTGEKIYEAGAIRPGSYVESVPLDAGLPAGVYEYTVVFFVYGEETEAFIGQAAAKLTLTLQE